ncbi:MULTISPECIES: DUF2523 domain-containing protein [Stenotrophomonas]|jgi:hypothetical protein|uniref:DUF2523 domain-containing protein n=1 Tax=Stenotrophomonas TaxID=40323 RepID=UPI0005198565|nr:MULTISPECIES: DUF2523 domain-containing protein [Stenotrophomonas]SSM87512.1 Protein of uncharacterised function (DUF2523) [Acinetobacter baumannii]EKT4102230.1 DUF2523 domain-containing protein [Stenotrophomonas maltophilia]KOO74415.1 hypothetical protein VK66_18255 [Stenotrophomonas maltophilia]KUJ04043.1 hypothetical protein AR275_26385 [Stenotrophomonas maltophilia]KWV48035.1 hypothetical protein AS591_13640 [Stenotrophomonas maltophilia]
MPWLAAFLVQLLGNSLARVLTGAGLGLATGAALLPLVKSALNLVVSYWGGISGDLANVLLLAGAGEAITIVGSAMVTKVVIDAGKVAVQKAASK